MNLYTRCNVNIYKWEERWIKLKGVYMCVCVCVNTFADILTMWYIDLLYSYSYQNCKWMYEYVMIYCAILVLLYHMFLIIHFDMERQTCITNRNISKRTIKELVIYLRNTRGPRIEPWGTPQIVTYLKCSYFRIEVAPLFKVLAS